MILLMHICDNAKNKNIDVEMQVSKEWVGLILQSKYTF